MSFQIQFCWICLLCWMNTKYNFLWFVLILLLLRIAWSKGSLPRMERSRRRATSHNTVRNRHETYVMTIIFITQFGEFVHICLFFFQNALTAYFIQNFNHILHFTPIKSCTKILPICDFFPPIFILIIWLVTLLCWYFDLGDKLFGISLKLFNWFSILDARKLDEFLRWELSKLSDLKLSVVQSEVCLVNIPMIGMQVQNDVWYFFYLRRYS